MTYKTPLDAIRGHEDVVFALPPRYTTFEEVERYIAPPAKERAEIEKKYPKRYFTSKRSLEMFYKDMRKFGYTPSQALKAAFDYRKHRGKEVTVPPNIKVKKITLPSDAELIEEPQYAIDSETGARIYYSPSEDQYYSYDEQNKVIRKIGKNIAIDITFSIETGEGHEPFYAEITVSGVFPGMDKNKFMTLENWIKDQVQGAFENETPGLALLVSKLDVDEIRKSLIKEGAEFTPTDEDIKSLSGEWQKVEKEIATPHGTKKSRNGPKYQLKFGRRIKKKKVK